MKRRDKITQDVIRAFERHAIVTTAKPIDEHERSTRIIDALGLRSLKGILLRASSAKRGSRETAETNPMSATRSWELLVEDATVSERAKGVRPESVGAVVLLDARDALHPDDAAARARALSPEGVVVLLRGKAKHRELAPALVARAPGLQGLAWAANDLAASERRVIIVLHASIAPRSRRAGGGSPRIRRSSHDGPVDPHLVHGASAVVPGDALARRSAAPRSASARVRLRARASPQGRGFAEDEEAPFVHTSVRVARAGGVVAESSFAVRSAEPPVMDTRPPNHRRSFNRAVRSHQAKAPAKEALSLVIASPIPEGPEGERWGDHHFAESLAGALRRRGHRVDVRRHARWMDAESVEETDAVVVLRGVTRMRPIRGSSRSSGSSVTRMT
ncbi:MAG: hypothetical protein HC923_09945 [Myxococcales bacterium]|nr:hypothetical protein [Myxococcales bacterium]